MRNKNCFLCKNTTGKVFVKKNINVVSVGNFNLGFKVCNGCGLVQQNPAVPLNKMIKYYKFVVDYTNSGNFGKPKKEKIISVIEQKKAVFKFLKKNCKILQIGSSDGYTLSQFKTNENYVVGIEPSLSSCRFAKKNYIIDKLIPRTFENSYKKLNKFDLIILTHVLEHIYNPLLMLKKLHSKLQDSGIILIEVPYLSQSKFLPNGYFTFEHLNYFDKYTLKKLILKSGYELIGKSHIDLKHNLYPIQRIVIKKSTKRIKKKENSEHGTFNLIKRNQNIMNKFEKKEKLIMKNMISKILKTTKNHTFSVWGAGIHSSYLFSYNRKILSKINYFVDSDKKKWGKKIYKKKIISPKSFIKKNNAKFLITSTLSEKEINKFLKKNNFKNKIVNLYE